MMNSNEVLPARAFGVPRPMMRKPTSYTLPPAITIRQPPPPEPPTETGDAFIALNGTTGDIVWKKQIVHHDVAGSIEADIGDSPQVYTLPSGKKVVGAGEKKIG